MLLCLLCVTVLPVTVYAVYRIPRTVLTVCHNVFSPNFSFQFSDIGVLSTRTTMKLLTRRPQRPGLAEEPRIAEKPSTGEPSPEKPPLDTGSAPVDTGSAPVHTLHVDVHGATGLVSGTSPCRVQLQVDDQTFSTSLELKAATNGFRKAEQTAVFRRPTHGLTQLVITVSTSSESGRTEKIELRLSVHGVLAYDDSRDLELDLAPLSGVLHLTVGWATSEAKTR